MWRKLIAALLVVQPVQAETPGAALFLRGEGATATIGGSAVQLPAARFACAGCHGADGAGRSEGATVFPAIGWSALTMGTGRRYDESTFNRALTEGIAPDGRTLSQAMPRYRSDQETYASLISHLARLDAPGSDGVAATEIRVRSTGDEALDRGFAAAAAAFNADGGAFGRLIVIADDPASFDLAAFDRDQADRIAAACLASALTAIRQEGHRTVRLSDPSDADVLYRLRSLGLSVDDAADAVLHTSSKSAASAPGLFHFGCIDQLGAAAPELVRAGGNVTLAVPDRAALSWAAASHQSADAMRGFAMGLLIGRAALTVGRDLTIPRLTETAATLPINYELLRFPSADRHNPR